jgi:hypothetical protein
MSRITILPCLAGAAALIVAVGCASGPSPGLRAASLSHPRAAEIWSDKCGSCHVPVEPGARPRGVLEAAMDRHQKRTKLTKEEWREIVDFLSHAPDRTAENHATTPAR